MAIWATIDHVKQGIICLIFFTSNFKFNLGKDIALRRCRWGWKLQSPIGILPNCFLFIQALKSISRRGKKKIQVLFNLIFLPYYVFHRHSPAVGTVFTPVNCRYSKTPSILWRGNVRWVIIIRCFEFLQNIHIVPHIQVYVLNKSHKIHKITSLHKYLKRTQFWNVSWVVLTKIPTPFPLYHHSHCLSVFSIWVYFVTKTEEVFLH